jgi:hypothetical protein
MWVVFITAIAAILDNTTTFHTPTQHYTTPSFPKTHPIASITYNADVSTSQKLVVGTAYRLVALYFPVSTESFDITIHVDNSSTPSSSSRSDNTITLYTTNIPDNNAFLAALFHELLHIFGFGPAFAATVNPITLAVNNGCFPYADETKTHWSNDIHDLMAPTIRNKLSACTLKTVLTSRPQWQTTACESDSECTNNTKCVSLGPYWSSACAHPIHLPPSPGFNRNIFPIVIATLCTFFAIVIISVKHPL